MASVTVSLSIPEALLRDMDQVAQRESRSRSELAREAIRSYIERKTEWEEIFASGRKLARARGLRPEDVAGEIAGYRREKAAGQAGQARSKAIRSARKEGGQEVEAVQPGSCLALVSDLIGSVAGPGDLSCNRKRLRGFGK